MVCRSIPTRHPSIRRFRLRVRRQPSLTPRSVRVKSKKGALRALGYDEHPQAHDVVNAGAFKSDRGLHGRVQAIVGDRHCRSGLIVAGGTLRITVNSHSRSGTAELTLRPTKTRVARTKS